MGRSPCCAKEGLNRGAWTAVEDKILTNYIKVHGDGKWNSLPRRAGLQRCGKSCRLRWMNYLRPDIKRGNISPEEDELIIRLHKLLGNRWSLIAGRLPGRTDNEIKNYWNTRLSKNEHRYPHLSIRRSSNESGAYLTNTCKEGSSPVAYGQPLTKKDINVVPSKAVNCSEVFIDHESQTTTPVFHDKRSGPVPIMVESKTPDDNNPNVFNTCNAPSLIGSQDFIMNIDVDEIISPLEFRDSWNNRFLSSQYSCPSPMLDHHLMLAEDILQDMI